MAARTSAELRQCRLLRSRSLSADSAISILCMVRLPKIAAAMEANYYRPPLAVGLALHPLSALVPEPSATLPPSHQSTSRVCIPLCDGWSCTDRLQ